MIYVDIFSALLTPVIAIVAIYIAYQQYKIGDLRLRHELYERRIKIYKAVQKYLLDVVGGGNTTYSACMLKHKEFSEEISEIPFLFDISVQKEIYTIYAKSIAMAGKSEELHLSDGLLMAQDDQERGKVIKEHTNLLKWHVEQLSVIKEIFVKEIGIKNTCKLFG